LLLLLQFDFFIGRFGLSFIYTEPACALGSCFVLHRFRAWCFFSQGCLFLALNPAAGPGLARAESALVVLTHSHSLVAGSVCFFSCLPRAGVCWSVQPFPRHDSPASILKLPPRSSSCFHRSIWALLQILICIVGSGLLTRPMSALVKSTLKR
jgi:hypothetical protein